MRQKCSKRHNSSTAPSAISPTHATNRMFACSYFGCGAGDLMNALTALGYATQGCDIVIYSEVAASDRVKKIAERPYRLPFEDDRFDVVVSTSVLEHVQNPEECMAEISRVLKPGGSAMHLMPTKHYLPSEPHIFVPLANFFWPRCPTWWFALWALLGWRAPFQKELTWRETVARNRDFFERHTNYLTPRRYDEISRRYFAESDWPMEFYIAHADGGYAALVRRLPFPRLSGCDFARIPDGVPGAAQAANMTPIDRQSRDILCFSGFDGTTMPAAGWTAAAGLRSLVRPSKDNTAGEALRCSRRDKRRPVRLARRPTICCGRPRRWRRSCASARRRPTRRAAFRMRPSRISGMPGSGT